MSKIIIGIHGLRNKPPRRVLKRWWKRSIREGLKAVGRPRWFFRFRLVYWADILHARPLNPREKNREHPRYLKSPYRAASDLKPKKNSALRKKVLEALEKQMDRIFLNDDLSINFSRITDFVIRRYFEDLDAYYSRTVLDRRKGNLPAKNLIQERLIRALRKHRKKQILLIAHSMGSIIAYDVLTRLVPEVTIDTFVTIGSPLGMPVIMGKILAEQDVSSTKKKLTVSENVLGHWFNFADLEDRVALNYNLADDYEKNSHGVCVVDTVVFNDYEMEGERNPHKSYGYLRTPKLAEVIHHFLNR